MRNLVVVALVFGALPFVAATNHVSFDGEPIEGRAILFDLTRFDPDLAAVAGSAKGTLSWFGGAVSVQRAQEGWIYAALAGTPDPVGKRLIPTGTWYNFTDHNGARWQVAEWYYHDVHEVQYRLGEATAVERIGLMVHVWTVRVADAPVTDTTLGVDYNFVIVLDTKKLGVTPVDETGVATDDPFFPRGGSGAGAVDLHFSRTDPRSICLHC